MMNAKGEDTLSFSLDFDLPHAPTKVWRALTEPALLAKWLMPTDMEAVVGKAFWFKTQPMPSWDGIVNCEMREVELHKRLQYSWGGNGLDTVVTWTLTPTKTGGTMLRLEHTGFPTGKENAQYFGGAKKGWQWMAGQRLLEVLAEVE
jgi:uncharacterized protein YndB with AHSA1/START domain